MPNSFVIEESLSAQPLEVYQAYLDSEKHSEMTGGEAQITPMEDVTFTAWDGYIEGKNLKLIDGIKITQEWRTSDFSDADESSILEITFEAAKDGCRIRLEHSNIPDGQPDYKQGWYDHYLNPMRAYFGNL